MSKFKTTFPRLPLIDVVNALRAGGYLKQSPWGGGMYRLFPAPHADGRAARVIADVPSSQVNILITNYGLNKVAGSPAIIHANRSRGDASEVYQLPPAAAGKAVRS